MPPSSAERRLGELLAERPKNKGTLRRGSELEPREDAPTLAEIGVDKKLSARAQKLAALTERDFDSRLDEWRKAAEENAGRARVAADAKGISERPISEVPTGGSWPPKFRA